MLKKADLKEKIDELSVKIQYFIINPANNWGVNKYKTSFTTRSNVFL